MQHVAHISGIWALNTKRMIHSLSLSLHVFLAFINFLSLHKNSKEKVNKLYLQM